MKKQLLLILMTLLPMVASADPVEIDGIYYKLITKVKQAEVARVPNNGSYSGNVDIPATVTYDGTEYSVTSIGDMAFWANYNLTSVKIPNSVTSIGKDAFEGCTALTSVSIPNSVTSIGEDAFWRCIKLTSVSIPNSVTSIGEAAFGACDELTSVKITDLAAWCNIEFSSPQSNPLFCAHHLYLNNEEIKDLVIPDSITSIGKYAFYDCGSLTSVTIPNSVTSIGVSVFYNCSGLESIIVELGNEMYDSRDKCNAIIETKTNSLIQGCKNTTIPNSVTSIAQNAFNGCFGLTSVDIPNSVTSIGGSAFYGCGGLTSVNIPNGVSTIESRTFENCNKLKTITLGWGVKYINEKAFSGCSELMDFYCYADKVPNTSWDVFTDSYTEYATLHVRESIMNAIKNATPWNNFKETVKLDIPKHKLTYLFEGVTYKVYEIEEGMSIIPEPAPNKEGYTFNRWEGLPERMLYEDITVTGSYTINNYKLFYVVDGNAYKSYDVEYGATITPEEEPTKEGFTFSGWSEIPETMPSHDVTVTGTFTPSQKCGKPFIYYENGRLTFTCDTEGVEYETEITDSDIKKHYESEITLTATYNISVYAKKAGYVNSDVVTATLCWIDKEPVIDVTVISQVPAQAVLMQSEGGMLTVHGLDDGTAVSVYGVNGTEAGAAVSRNGQAQVNTNLSAGSIAIVKIGEKSVKVVIK